LLKRTWIKRIFGIKRIKKEEDKERRICLKQDLHDSQDFQEKSKKNEEQNKERRICLKQDLQDSQDFQEKKIRHIVF